MDSTPDKVPGRPPRGPKPAGLGIEAAERIRAFGWASFPAFFMGGVVWVSFGTLAGVLTMAGVFFGVAGVSLAFAGMVGGTMRGATNPRGRPRPTDHSKADTFAARGDPFGAIAVLEASLAEFPDDPAAYIRIARIRRDSLKDPEGALAAFRAARDISAPTASEQRITMREMVDLAEAMGDPLLVAPDLARHRDAFAGTEEEAWAAAELAEAKRALEE
jgi:hypothetical protein